MLAAAALAGVKQVLAVGGPHAIGALAYGFAGYPKCDLIVGPGNKWVTAAKKLVAGEVAIDMLAGPTELLILADAKEPPELLAADLLAQAEHDPEARPMLVALDKNLISRVEAEIAEQRKTLTTADVTRQAFKNGFAVAAKNLSEALRVCDALAPEHLQICMKQAPAVAKKIKHAGAVFIGTGSAEVYGDYGFGPNHVLPTSGAARYTGGLSVMNFLRLRTWLEITAPEKARQARNDAIQLARLESLEAHARAAECRK
jgi:phosphoribosyl-ATP pyrophosphohydrolase/phosphoribosyl-AMP cyclohydrolase/histidinol dehydrogenase